MALVQTEFIQGITIRPLRRGDSEAIQAVFDGLGPRSRLLRFGGAKNLLLASDLELLTRVDENHHVLVAYIGREPVGVARLVRDGKVAEVAFAVADQWQRRGIGTVLVERLAADARAAGIESFRADIAPGNTASQALLRRLQVAA
jgi:N-acetylglutamate synthase-like GNAT family acetyltransferase